MKARMINTVHLEGQLYDHKLELRVSGPNSKNPGTQFIMGTVRVATDAERTNIVDVHYTYVTATTSKGAANASFTTLKNIIDGVAKTYMAAGDEAAYVRIDTSIGVNDFYTSRNGGEEQLVSAKRNEGGFIHIIQRSELNPDIDARNHFDADMIITSAINVEADTERNLPEKVVLKGVIFDFRKAIMPVEFNVTDAGGMNYFLGMEPSSSNPLFTKVMGTQISETVVREFTEETAFGGPYVRKTTNSRREFLVTSCAQEPYVWDSEESITADELRKAIADRNTYLATVKQRSDEYKASKASGGTAAAAAPKAAIDPGADFNF